MDENKTIEFGRKDLDPSKEEQYRRKIEEGKSKAMNSVDLLKGSTPLGHTEKPVMPILADTRKRAVEASGITADGGVAPRPSGAPAVRQETVAQLKAFEKASAAQTEDDKKIEDQAKKDLEEEYAEYDLGPRNEAQLVLVNQKRRKEIEARCEPMLIEDLILRGEVKQVIPIVPDKFVVEFRSTLPEESLFIKRRVALEKAVSDQHTLERYGLLNLCCSLVQVNGEKFPSHLDENQSPSDVLFDKKFARMMKLSGYVITDLMVNVAWFDIRVRKLLNSDAMGNG